MQADAERSEASTSREKLCVTLNDADSCGRWRLSQVPEAAWLLRQLLEYAYSGPKPTKGLAVKVTECPGCMPSSFVALCGA